ncbi:MULTISPECIES: bacteriophage antitermination protein Q [Klebsiella]|uniref:bacteriophage antitermination protein Q n=1 Tax=Klebsiella TaxID=570 RepID=UPI0006680127|nr:MULTISPECIES: bacteriophage antitermination protein Q [Klebsiella]MEC6162735.1 bacteriophage antitermination protein Q [Klebsiella grimontii]UHC97795.1 bacteriophage antitermination protein Q [Klebsiella pasteurii]UXO76671.1 bacteriophage antitermination protein Q [Klebsiella michiganensis]
MKNLSYIRQQLIVATADLSGATKGQLMAWLENAQFDTNTFPRKKQRVWDEETEKWMTLNNPPIPGKQSHAKGSHIPLVQPVEYATASWRRALLSLDQHQKAWLLWNYSENTSWEYQETIIRWAWEQFSQQLAGVRIAKKTVERLRQLIWLAAQDVKAELAGCDIYKYQKLAELGGVAKSTWSETYLPHWLAMRCSFVRLDCEALISLTRTRSQQKATNLAISLAKPN